MYRTDGSLAVSVTQMGYVGLSVSDSAAWKDFLENLMGLRCTAQTPDYAQFRMDERLVRLILFPEEADGLAFIGWQAADRAAMEAIGARAQAAGSVVSKGTAAEARIRGVSEFIWFRDPDDLRVEIFHGAAVDFLPFVSSRGITFVAGNLGFGHAALRVTDREVSVAYYQRVLGCRESDHIVWEQDGLERHLTFMHVNARHHSVAMLGELTEEQKQKNNRILHLMIQVSTLDEVGYTYDLVAARGLWHSTIGKHTNDRMISFYVRTPSGFSIEYGFGGRELLPNEAEPVVVYNNTELWGHVRPK